MINSVSQAVLVYAFSFRKGAILALGGNSGNPIYDVSDRSPVFNTHNIIWI